MLPKTRIRKYFSILVVISTTFLILLITVTMRMSFSPKKTSSLPKPEFKMSHSPKKTSLWPKPEFKMSHSPKETSSLPKPEFKPPVEIKTVLDRPHCETLNMLDHMTQGRWVLRQYTDTEKKNLETKLDRLLKVSRFSQRNDILCGNVTFDNSPFQRALCNPYGSLPCCYRNRCVQRDMNSCRCDHCYDQRQIIQAELASWIPSNPTKRIYYFQGHEDSCQHFKNMTVYIIGDSCQRHIFASMLSLLNSDKKYGPLRNTSTSKEIERCKDITLYTPKCKFGIERGIARPCNQTGITDTRIINRFHRFMEKMGHRVEMKFIEVWGTTETRKAIAAFDHLEKRPNSWIIVGIGVHDNYNSKKVISKFLKPLLKSKRYSKSMWPKLLWSAAHAPGLLKSPKFVEQDRNATLAFNFDLQKVLDQARVPTFHSFQLTDKVFSYDGTHYGKGANDLKAQILLNYLACQNTYFR